MGTLTRNSCSEFAFSFPASFKCVVLCCPAEPLPPENVVAEGSGHEDDELVVTWDPPAGDSIQVRTRKFFLNERVCCKKP